ncbi:MAG: DUF2939 domain-containing protein [Hyphomicrobiaceae bacterium]
MRELARKLSISLILMAALAYLFAPFYTAWSIRQAIRTNDPQTLRELVDWASVRTTLRQSIAHHAELLPAAVKVGRQIRPTMWQRVKAMFGESMLDRFMDRYITAEGMPQLYRLKHGYRTRVQGLADVRNLPLKAQIADVVRRVKRAEFITFGHVEIEVVDRDDPERRIVGGLQLVGLQWKLTSLVVKRAQTLTDASDEETRLYLDDLKNGRLHRASGA